MINLLFALGLGFLVSMGLYASHLLKLGEASVPGILVMFIAYFVLARKTFKEVERIAMGAAKHLQNIPPKFDAAILHLQKAYALARKQFGVKSQIDGQIGMIYFLNQDFNKALPYLKSSQLLLSHWSSTAMLGVIYYKKKEHAEMRKTMDWVVKRAKGNSLAWNLYAYLLQQIGDKAAAIKVLNQALKATKEDARIKEALLAVQNDKKFKMKVYKEQWYQFHLERPPVEQQNAYMGRPGKIARRGRW